MYRYPMFPIAVCLMACGGRTPASPSLSGDSGASPQSDSPAPSGDEDGGAETPLKSETLDDFAMPVEFTEAEGFAYAAVPSAKHALAAVIRATAPRVIGFGEFHQTEETASTRSALERFSGDLLPLLGEGLSDLVVETWIPTGCGETEEKVVEDVAEVTERPEATENETVRLLKAADALGVTSHILTVACDDYQSVFLEDGTVDYFRMLKLVGKLLGQKAAQVLVYRLREGEQSGEGYAKTIAVYGGAVHNDTAPSETWRPVSFGVALAPAVENATGGRYLAVDLYVPEFIEKSDILKQEPWFETFLNTASKEHALLIRLAPDSYIIVFRRGVNSGDTDASREP